MSTPHNPGTTHVPGTSTILPGTVVASRMHRLLSECRDVAVAEFTEAMSHALTSAYDDLCKLPLQAQDKTLSQLLTETLEMTRSRREELLAAFGRHLAERTGLERHINQHAGADVRPAGNGELRLVSDDEEQDSAAFNSISDAIGRTCHGELLGLRKRIERLAREAGMHYHSNPFGPGMIGESMIDAFKELGIAPRNRRVLIPLINKYLPPLTRTIYQMLHDDLADGMRQLAPKMPADSAKQRREEERAVLDTATLQKNRHTAQVQLLKLIHGEFNELTPDFARFAAIAPDDPHLLQQLRDANTLAGLGQADHVALGLAITVFDSRLADRRINDSMKALIAQLQIPLFIAALQDMTALTVKAHPARAVLDALSMTGLGLSENELRSSGLYAQAQKLVSDLLQRYQGQADFFTEALPRFERLRSESKQRIIHAQALSSAQRPVDKAAATANALAEIHRRVARRQLPEPALAFLFSHGRHFLVLAHQHSGGQGPMWLRAIEALDGLARTLDPAQWRQDRAAQAAQLPALLRSIRQILLECGSEPAVRDRFFAELMKCHAQAIQTPSTEHKAIAATSSPAAKLPESGVQAQTRQGDRYDSLVESLKPGTWIEIQRHHGARIRLQLSWTSPMRGVFLFSNADGQRVLSITASELAARFRSGSIGVVTPETAALAASTTAPQSQAA